MDPPKGLILVLLTALVLTAQSSPEKDQSSSKSDEISEDIIEEGFPPNGRCYRFINDKHLYGHDQYMVDASDLQDCLSKCDMEQAFTCLAVNYLPSGVCELMPLTQEEEPDLFDVFDGSVYAEVTQCQSDHTRRFIFRESMEDSNQLHSSSESDEGSGSLSDENNFELYDWM